MDKITIDRADLEAGLTKLRRERGSAALAGKATGTISRQIAEAEDALATAADAEAARVRAERACRIREATAP